MAWKVIYHHGVRKDLNDLGNSRAQKVLRVIDERIENGEPDKSGKSLSGELAGYRRIRTGDIRIVYRIVNQSIEVFIVAVGNRRDDEVYQIAVSRLQ
jgi:mRNA interferase RelE/StbE